MPKYRIQTPDGRVAVVEANDEASAMAGVKSTFAATSDATKRSKSTPNAVRALSQGVSMGWSDEADALLAKATTALNPKRQYSPQQAYDAVMSAERDRSREFEQSNPVASTGLLATGGIGGALALPGGKALAGFVKGGIPAAKSLPVIGGLLGGRGLVAGSARAAAEGGLLGGLSGAGMAQQGRRAEGARSGAKVGAALGAAAPSVIAAGTSAAKAGGRIVNAATQGGAGRAVNSLAGREVVSPQRNAVARVIEALKRDGASPDQIKAAANEWLKTGASTPAFMDVVRKLPKGGESTMGLIRGSALKATPAKAAVRKYSDQVAGDLQDNAINRAKALTPDRRPASVVADDLEIRQQMGAQVDYAPAYAQQVEPTEDVMAALAGAPGRAALQRARSAAEAQMRPEQVADIDRLLSGEAGPVSAATLDRLKIAMRERGEQAARRGANDMRSGLQQRTGMIDSGLEGVEGLADARQAYSGMQRQRDALDIGRTGLSESPDDFALALDGASPEALDAAGVGYRQSMTDAIGAPTAGATGILNRLSSASNQGRNLETVFGGDEAQRFQGAIGNEVERVKNARHIDPDFGSQSAGLISDGLVDLGDIPTNTAGLAKALIAKLRGASTITDAEREGVVNLGISPANDIIPQIDRTLEEMLQRRLRGSGAAGIGAGVLGGRAGGQ